MRIKHSYQLWALFFAHIVVFVMLMAMQAGIAGQLSIFTEQYWTQVQFTFLEKFSSSAAQLLVLFLLVSPIWAVFITRNMPYYGKIIHVLAWVWIVICLLFYAKYFVMQAWMIWFLYASIMLLLGLSGVIYRVFTGQEELATSNTE